MGGDGALRCLLGLVARSKLKGSPGQRSEGVAVGRVGFQHAPRQGGDLAPFACGAQQRQAAGAFLFGSGAAGGGCVQRGEPVGWAAPGEIEIGQDEGRGRIVRRSIDGHPVEGLRGGVFALGGKRGSRVQRTGDRRGRSGVRQGDCCAPGEDEDGGEDERQGCAARVRGHRFIGSGQVGGTTEGRTYGPGWAPRDGRGASGRRLRDHA